MINNIEPAPASLAARVRAIPAYLVEQAPISKLVFEWTDSGHYSEQCLRRLVQARVDAAWFGATRGVRAYRYIQQANVEFLDAVMDALDEKVQVAA